MRQERRVTRLDRHYLRTSADVVSDDVGWIEIVQLAVDVTVATVWLDPPHPARTMAARAIAVFFSCIERG